MHPLQWRLRAGAGLVLLLALGACRTSFRIAEDAGSDMTADAELDASRDSTVPDDVDVIDAPLDAPVTSCEARWRPPPLSAGAPPPNVLVDEEAPFNDPNFGTCLEQLDPVPENLQLSQNTPEWLVLTGANVRRAVERSSGGVVRLPVESGLGRVFSATDYGYFLYRLDVNIEAPGPSSFCVRPVSVDDSTCADLSEATSWSPQLAAPIGPNLSVRRRAVAIDESGRAVGWAALVLDCGVEASRADCLADLSRALIAHRLASGSTFTHIDAPEPIVQALRNEESVLVRLTPDARYIFIASPDRLWRFDAENGFAATDALALAAERGREAVAVGGPFFAYGDASATLRATDGVEAPIEVGAFASRPCGEGASVICDGVRIRLGIPPASQPGWVSLALRADPGADEEDRPWAAGRIGLVPLRESADYETATWHGGRPGLLGSSWTFSMSTGAAPDGTPELIWPRETSSDTSSFLRATFTTNWARAVEAR